ncbi:transcription factor atf21 [Colletotrichum karsti]|uniref:Transcription factor atf21 n=1 Tax=Colletotrichum karsti TaxID=1095194 RepID=A0A9P6ICS4_9PEZI|nr:transcription factor atf21 [Colletotrichum karsti]KAF9878166.1 transcription factor atf21 [Colletotrichum karsti]
MAFGSAGVSTLQSGLPGNALFELLSNPSAQSTGESYAQQEQHQQHGHEDQQANFFFQQQLKNTAENDAGNGSQPTFVAPSALTTAPEAAPSLISSDSRSSISAPSSRGWQDSPVSHTLSSPATSITSPHSSLVSPPVDPRLLIPPQDAKPQTQPAQPHEAVDAIETPKRRRGRPRLSDATNTRDTRVTRVGAVAKEDAPRTKTQQKTAAARRASTASASGADDVKNENTVDDKKSRIRARNREAAYKCRQKKQKGIEELQSQEAVAEDINKTLHSEAAMLRSEILMLKNMVLQHGGCGCSYIEEYISGAAQNLVHTSMAASSAQNAARGVAMNAQPDMNGQEGDTYVDWKMFDMDRKPGTGALDSESGFSGLDDISVTHSTRAASQGVTMA